MACRLSSVPVAVAVAAALWGCEGSPEFGLRIPNGQNVMYMGQRCPGVGHLTCEGGMPGGMAAPDGVETVSSTFGQLFEDNNNTWTKEVCMADSDGDGTSNGFELGDPDCTWTIGMTPKRTTNITHPGIAEGMTTTNYASLTSTTTTTTNKTASAAAPKHVLGVSMAAVGSLLARWY